MRSWVEPTELAVPKGQLGQNGDLPDGDLHHSVGPMWRLTENWWVVINRTHGRTLFAIILHGKDRRFSSFFAVNIATERRRAYFKVIKGFAAWCEERGSGGIDQGNPIYVATYVEQLGRTHAKHTVKQLSRSTQIPELRCGIFNRPGILLSKAERLSGRSLFGV